MKIKCLTLTNLSEFSSKPHFENLQITEHYDDILKKGGSYHVYGISLWRNTLNYLIDVPLGKRTNPEWVHAGIFEITDNSLPIGMHFRYFGPSDKRGVTALWGYRELILDYDHYEGLIEMDEMAIAIFAKRKEEIDQQIPDTKDEPAD